MRQVVLASTSRYRAALLDQLAATFLADAPDYEESNDSDVAPELLVSQQALGKAESLRTRYPEALILGSDQVAEVDGKILTKPGSHERAALQLRMLQGRQHRLLTAVALLDATTGSVQTHLDVTRLNMRALSDEEITAYVRYDSPIDCAGSYKVESLGVSLFDSIQGDDATAVVGLPLMAVARMLREADVNVTLA